MTYRYPKKIFDGADGFLLKHKDTYYIYCTTENDLPAFTAEHPFYETFAKDGRDGIEVHVSKDLVHWENAGYCLTKADSVGTHGFWAPEVSFYRGAFYMVYTVDERVAVARAESPLGPFRSFTPSYLINKPAIDGHLFFDEDGRIYLYYAELSCGNRICVAELSEDLAHVIRVCDRILISAEEAWETAEGCVAEGPFVCKHHGIYYLTYSANHTRNENYAMGYATATAPTGPFQKSRNNPILHKFDDIVGTGHHSLCSTDDPDRYLCIYHCHGGDIGGFKPRKLCLAEARFQKGDDGEPDELVILQ